MILRRIRLDARIPRWLSAHEIAELGLDGLPSNAQQIREIAGLEKWVFVKDGRADGDPLYGVRWLPEMALEDLRSRFRKKPGLPTRPNGRPKGLNFFTKNPAIAVQVDCLLGQGASASSIREAVRRAHGTAPSLRAIHRYAASRREGGAA